MLLAIDTSVDYACLALVREDQILAEVSWLCQNQHSQELLPNLQLLLQRMGREVQDISAVAVARGPGSFNGLRVGVTTAKALAFSRGLPLVAMSTLEIIAYTQVAARLPICALLNAGRGEVAAGVYMQTAQGWNMLMEEHITTLSSLLCEVPSGAIFCGEISPEQMDLIYRARGSGARVASRVLSSSRCGSLAELGSYYLRSDKLASSSTLEPVYLRSPSITRAKRHKGNEPVG